MFKNLANLAFSRLFGDLIFQWKLARLHADRHALDKLLAARLAEAREKKFTTDQFDYIHQDFEADFRLMDEEIDVAVSRHWVSKASQLFLEIPNYRDETLWEKGHYLGMNALTNKGVSLLRESVRKENTARFAFWEKVFAGLWTLASTLFGYWLGKG